MAEEVELIPGNIIVDHFTGHKEEDEMSFSHKLRVEGFFLPFCGRMEFATEMIAELRQMRHRIGEVSVPLRKNQNERQKKLHTIRDGFRHYRDILRG